jgi:hypothetical protein
LERSERVVRSKAEVVDCRKRTMPLPSERFFAVGSRSELGMDEEGQPGDYGSATLRVRTVLPYHRPLGTVSGGLSLRACVEGTLRNHPHRCRRRGYYSCECFPHSEVSSHGLRSLGMIYAGGGCGG